jgi:hypothetical protein
MNYPYSNYFWDIQLARKRLTQALAGPGRECCPLEGRRVVASLTPAEVFGQGSGRNDAIPFSGASATGGKQNNRNAHQDILLIESCRMMRKSG